MGVCRLLESALDYWRKLTRPGRTDFRFLQVSTDAVYGSLHDLGTSAETAAFEPNTPYAASKAASDHFVRAFHRSFGLPTLTVNSSNNYGPYQFPTRLIPSMILHALRGQNMPIEGEGLHLRDWLHVEDHCRAIMLVLEQGRVGDTYNVSSGAERTNLEVLLAVCDLLDKLRPDLPQRPCDSLLHHAPDRPGRDAQRAVDASKLRYRTRLDPGDAVRRGPGEHRRLVSRQSVLGRASCLRRRSTRSVAACRRGNPLGESRADPHGVRAMES